MYAKKYFVKPTKAGPASECSVDFFDMNRGKTAKSSSAVAFLHSSM
jgi:hypothetical protein